MREDLAAAAQIPDALRSIRTTNALAMWRRKDDL